jgi:hypothetical protein
LEEKSKRILDIAVPATINNVFQTLVGFVQVLLDYKSLERKSRNSLAYTCVLGERKLRFLLSVT